MATNDPIIWVFPILIRAHSETEVSGSSLVCSTSLMASLIRSVGGLSKCFYQDLWLAVLSADVIGQSINKRGVAYEFPYYGMVSSSVSARFLYGFPYRFQRAWTVLCNMKHPLDVVRVGAWNSLVRASRVRSGESGTPSTIIYVRWSSRRYELGCDTPVCVTRVPYVCRDR